MKYPRAVMGNTAFGGKYAHLLALCAATVFLPSFAGEWGEIVFADIPGEISQRFGALIPLDAASCVQTGMVGHFDAIRNAGESLPHDISSRVWKNLVAGQPDAAFNTGNGYWTEDGFVFTGNVHASVDSPGIDIGGPFMTVQLVTDVDWASQVFGSGYFSIFFGNDENNTDIYFNSSSANHTLILNADKWGTNGNRPTLEWDGRYATAILGDGISYLVQDTVLSGGKTRVNTDIPARRFSWGGQQDNANYYAKGTFHSVRIYNRALGEGELAWNRMLDEVRYRGADSNINVIVKSSVEGVEATEKSGMYMVNGHHVFTAPASVVSGHATYVPTGYALEVWDASKNAWGEAEAHDGETTFDYTNCLARAKVRITWNWTINECVDEWAEITFADIPGEISQRFGALVPLDAASCVQTGMAGHFDAIRNAGESLPHDISSRVWKNLVGGQPDAAFNTGNGYWTEDGFVFTGNVHASVDSPGIDIGGPFMTVQLVTDVDWAAQVFGNGYYSIFFGNNNNDTDIYFNSSSANRTLTLNADKWGTSGNRPTLEWDGRYATAILGDGISYLVQDTVLSGGKTRVNTAIPARRFSWGGQQDNAYYYAKGTFHSVRIYNRALDEGELAWNRMLDEVRYRGADTNINVIVASGVAGVEATERSGRYMVNGRHIFTAPASVASGNATYVPAGYALEVWDASKHAWGEAEAHDGETSFDYTNCLARAKVRILWKWNLASGVKRLDADDYAQNGLILNFDGIRNAGLGVPHDAEATSWANLGSLGGVVDAGKKSFARTGSLSGDGSWDTDGFCFRGRDYFELKANVNPGIASTTQIVSAYDNAEAAAHQTDGVGWPHFFGTVDLTDWFNLYTNADGADRNDMLFSKMFGSPLVRMMSGVFDGRFVNRIYDSAKANKATLMASCGASWNTTDLSVAANVPVGARKLAIGTGGVTDDDRFMRSFIGKICAVRLYDRVLSDGEIARNRAIDEARFFGRLADLDETDVVLVRNESFGGAVKFDDDGAYIVRNATKTFAVQATVEVGQATYACAGYRLETWNPETRRWSVTQTGEGCSLDLAGSSGAANRRLTWIWNTTSALRTAADYTALEYVQDGLVGNFDGISNAGAGHPHNTLTRRWRNLVSDQPGATFNTGNGYWTEDGFVFTGNVHASVDSPGIGIGGPFMTVQLVSDVDWAAQAFGSGYFSIFFGNDENNTDIYFNSSSKNRTLILNADKWGTGGNRPTLEWDGRYATAVLGDGISYLLQDTALSGGKTRVNTAIPARRFSWGGQQDNAYYYAKGTFHSVRIYNRALTEAELVHNRKVDEIRFRNAFPEYANLIVVNGMVGKTGVVGTSSLASGEYELTGTMTVTADPVTVDGEVYRPMLSVEKFTDGEWRSVSRAWINSCTVTGAERTRLMWTWEHKTGTLLLVR